MLHAKVTGSSRPSPHAKKFVLDEKAMFAGSANLDLRAGKLNTEPGTMFESEPLASASTDWLDENRARIAYAITVGRSQCARQQPCVGRLRCTDEQPSAARAVYLAYSKIDARNRFFVSLASLPPIEGQL